MSKLIKYIILLVWVSRTTTEKTVKLIATTASCGNSCSSNDNDDACRSSITFGNEKMDGKDGFNIMIIDNNTGKVLKRKYLRWFNEVAFYRRNQFKKFISSIKSKSTVIITFQNMCKNLLRKWYTYLYGLLHSVTYKEHANQAIVVACKGPCPRTVKERLPFTYYSSGRTFEKTITFKFPIDDSSYKRNVIAGQYKANIPAIAGGIASSIIIVTVLYACYLYLRQRHVHDDDMMHNMTGANPNASREENEPIYEEIHHSGLPIYDRIDDTHGNTNHTVSPLVMNDLSGGQTYPGTLAGSSLEFEKPPLFPRGHSKVVASAPPIELDTSL